MSALAPTMQAFFTDRLTKQRNASQHTIAAYRDTMRLLLAFASERSAKPPSELDISDLDAPLIGAFLDHLEHERANSIRTRNARLAAIRSLFRYAALSEASDNAAYRDTLRLLLRFASERTGKQPCQLDIADLDAPLIGAFLDHLENDRGNTPRTRNARLAAIHSLYRFASLRHPEHAQTLARVIEIPPKRHNRPLISYLDEQEIKALLAAPDRSTWLGRRDHALLLTASKPVCASPSSPPCATATSA
jgi:site-specific recombinase XerD